MTRNKYQDSFEHLTIPAGTRTNVDGTSTPMFRRVWHVGRVDGKPVNTTRECTRRRRRDERRYARALAAYARAWVNT